MQQYHHLPRPFYPNNTTTAPSAVHHHPSYAMDAHILSAPPPGSDDATAWGEWGAAHGEQSWQYSKAVQEVTRIRKARTGSTRDIYTPHPTYFPTAAGPHTHHQGFAPSYY